MADEKVAGASGDGRLAWILGGAAGAAVAVAAWYFGLRDPAPVPDSAPAQVVSVPQPTVSEPTAPDPAVADPATASAEPAAADPTPEPEAQAAAPEAEPEAAAVPAPETAAAPVPAAAPMAPTFDTVRVDADGATLVAGRAGDGTQVAVLVDGAEAATAAVDGRGAFAALFTLMPSDQPRVMRLESVLADGTRVPSAAEVIVAPFAAPDAVAAAEPAATGTATETATATEAAADASPAPEPAETAPQPGPEVLIVDAGGVRKQPVPEPVADIVIDTIGYSAEGDVEIAGRGRAGSFARLYLDNAEAATVPVAETGAWRAVLRSVAPGIYTLRVDQVDAEGKVSSRFETPFQREAPETVVAALGGASTAETAPLAEPAAASDPALAAGGAPAAPAPAEPASPGTLSAAETPAVAATAAAAPPTTAEAPAPQALATGATAAATPATQAVIVTVQPGFTLWRIARENYGDGVLYVKVFEANKDLIRNPDLIYPGQIFTVPASE